MAAIANKTFSFDLILGGVDVITVEMADALFEAGCDDSSPSSSGGIVTIHFDREARSLSEAVGTAIANVEQAGLKIARIAIEETAASSRPGRRVRVAGRMETPSDSGKRFTLVLSDGNSVIVMVANDQGIAGLQEQPVVASGRGVFDSSGTLLHVEADYLAAALPSDLAVWSVLPQPDKRKLDSQALRRPQTPATGINAILGQWPGDETDEEIEAYLKEIS